MPLSGRFNNEAGLKPFFAIDAKDASYVTGYVTRHYPVYKNPG
jgi:hypothetical protein